MRIHERWIVLTTLFAVGVLWGVVSIEGARDWLERSAAGTPATGYVRTYAATDGAMHAIDDAGVDTAFVGTPSAQSLDFSGATLEAPNSTTLPGTCTVGTLYLDTDAAAASQLYACTATDTWTVQGGGGGDAWTSLGSDGPDAMVCNTSGSFNVVNTFDIPAGTLVAGDVLVIRGMTHADSGNLGVYSAKMTIGGGNLSQATSVIAADGSFHDAHCNVISEVLLFCGNLVTYNANADVSGKHLTP